VPNYLLAIRKIFAKVCVELYCHAGCIQETTAVC